MERVEKMEIPQANNEMKWIGILPKSTMSISVVADSEDNARKQIAQDCKDSWLLDEWAKGGAIIKSEKQLYLEYLIMKREELMVELEKVNNEIDKSG